MGKVAVVRSRARKAKSVREQVGEAEWAVRVDLAACYRLMVKFGLTDLIYNHITAKVPGPDKHFLINPYGLHYSEITASNLYKIDLEGNPVLAPELDFKFALNMAGYHIHSAIHGARNDVGCVVHTHSRAGMAVSAMEDGLLPLTQTALYLLHDVCYHEYGVPARAEEGQEMIRSIGNKNHMILRNHGLLTCGETVGQAFRNMYLLEQACKAQVDALAGGVKLHFPSKAVQEAIQADAAAMKLTARKEWSAMIRLLDREDPGYRD